MSSRVKYPGTDTGLAQIGQGVEDNTKSAIAFQPQCLLISGDASHVSSVALPCVVCEVRMQDTPTQTKLTVEDTQTQREWQDVPALIAPVFA